MRRSYQSPSSLAILALVLVECVLLLARGQAAPAPLGEPFLRPGERLRREVGIVNRLLVDRYTWLDSQARPRSVSLVRYGQKLDGAPRGGYANQFTFQELRAGAWRTVAIDPPPFRGDAGFGYFVSHEAWRYFDANVCPDGSNNCTIAAVHGQDDSPLGLALPGSGAPVSVTASAAIHEFRMNYPHWGTTVPVPNPSSDLTPGAGTYHRKYNLPVVMRWTLRSGMDYPLWGVTYDLGAVPVNRLSVDMRGPYGFMLFAPGDPYVGSVQWGDQYLFRSTQSPVTTQSTWNWYARNSGARFNLLVAGNYEMGLVQDIPYSRSRTGSIWSGLRGSTSARGSGCPDAGWLMPCNWQWTYQSIQYEGFNNQATRAKKLAWGTSPYIGTSKTTDDNGQPFSGYPKVTYRVWITFGRTGGRATRDLAAAIQ